MYVLQVSKCTFLNIWKLIFRLNELMINFQKNMTDNFEEGICFTLEYTLLANSIHCILLDVVCT